MRRVPLPYLIASAIVPSLLLLWYFRSRDANPEPGRVVWTTFGLGILSVFPVLLVASPAQALLKGTGDPFLRGLGEAFLVAAFPEELFKLLVLLLYTCRQADFDEPMDGLVYGAVASLGFATLENVLYVSGGGVTLAIARALTAVPMHAFAGAIMGYYVGQALFDPPRRRSALFKAYAVPVLFHGVYDFPLLTMKYLKLARPGLGALVGLSLVLLAVVVLVVEVVMAQKLARRLRAEQRFAQVAHESMPPPAPLAGDATMVMSAVAGLVGSEPRRPLLASGVILCVLGGILLTAGALLLTTVAVALSTGQAGKIGQVIAVTIVALVPSAGGALLFRAGLKRRRALPPRQALLGHAPAPHASALSAHTSAASR